MDTYISPHELMQYRCIRTERQRKRAKKEDRDKQLLRLNKQLNSLVKQHRQLPMVPLAEPYQRGWKRHFVLHDNVKNSESGPFYEQLLTKINCVQYHYSHTFRRKRNRSKKKMVVIDQPVLKAFDKYEWMRTGLLTEVERECFHTELRWDKYRCCYNIVYVFNEPWRYVIIVQPNIIHEAKLNDELLEQQIAWVDDFLEQDNRWLTLRRLLDGAYGWKRRKEPLKPKEKEYFKKQPLHKILNEHWYQQQTT